MPSINQLRTNLSSSPLTTQRSGEQKEKAQVNQTSEQQQTDQVSLSSQAKSAGSIHKELAAMPESFDNQKVSQIKEAIANGSYVIDAEKLASNLLKFEDELNGM